MTANTEVEKPKLYRVHFSEITFSTVELEASDVKVAAHAATAAFAGSAKCQFRTSPAAFRIEVRREATDGTFYWEPLKLGA